MGEGVQFVRSQEWYTEAGRLVLGDISRSPFAGRGNVVSSTLDMYSPASSPDEEVIYIRGRRTHQDILSSTFSEYDSDDDSADFLWSSPKTETESHTRKQLHSSRLEERKRQKLMDMKPDFKEAVSLQVELQAFSRDQLSRTINRLVTTHPQLETEVRESLSVPDLRPMTERLEYLKRAVYRAFPTFRWGSSRNSYCYRRVRVPIDIFKRTCVDQARALVSSQCWESVLNYIEIAWAYVHQLPKFDDPANNRPRLTCFRFLSAQCMAAILNGHFSIEKLIEIREKLTRMYRLHHEIEPCMRKIEKLLVEQNNNNNNSLTTANGEKIPVIPQVDSSSSFESSTPNAKSSTRTFRALDSSFVMAEFSRALSPDELIKMPDSPVSDEVRPCSDTAKTD